LKPIAQLHQKEFTRNLSFNNRKQQNKSVLNINAHHQFGTFY